MIYTTYLSNIKHIPDSACKIFISREASSSVKDTLSKYGCIWALSLAPSKSLLDRYKRLDDWNDFRNIFIKEKSVCAKWEAKEIEFIKSECIDRDVYFICYEKDHLRCHRSIVASAFAKKIDMEWEEKNFDEIKSKNR